MNMINNRLDAVEFRHLLHSLPELAGKERQAARLIYEQLKVFGPDLIINRIGGWGVIAVFAGKQSGPNVVFRAELDALRIKEDNDFDYKSLNPGLSHACGHDGHCAILVNLAKKLSMNREKFAGNAILLFQPAEETGEGAIKILDDDKFNNLKPDYIFALHNIPGEKDNAVLIKKGVFACASKGIIIKLKGKITHSAFPEFGQSPAKAMTGIIDNLPLVPSQLKLNPTANKVSVIHSILGEKAFGTMPDYAEVMATLRADSDDNMQKIIEAVSDIIKNKCSQEKIACEISFSDDFPALYNDDEALDIVINSAKKANADIEILEKPFPWSEDFAYYTKYIKGAYFGIGAGEGHPLLHYSNYDFPDSIINTATDVLFNIVKM